MTARPEPSSQPSTEGLLAAGPKRIVWHVAELASGDGHLFTADFSATATITASAADAAMIRETFDCDPASLTVETVRERLLRVVATELNRQIQQQEAEAFDTAQTVVAVRESAAQALRVAGFSAGIRFIEPFALSLESPTRKRQAIESAARARAAEALAQATNTMQQFQKLRSEQPDASMGQVLNQIGSSASETLLPTLLKGWADQKFASRIIVTSGEQVFSFSLSGETWIPKPLAFTNPIGALRTALPLSCSQGRGTEGEGFFDSRSPLANQEPLSPTLSPEYRDEGGSNSRVQTTSRTLSELPAIALGGQRGVALVVGNETKHFAVPPDRISQLGINSIAIGSSQLFATHSEFGLFIWSLSDPNSPQLHACPQAKFATMLDSTRCIFAASDQLFIADAQEIRPLAKATPAGVVSILTSDDGLRVVFADGTVAGITPREPTLKIESKLGETISLATTLDWLGESRLLIANDRGEIELVGPSSRTRFLSSHGGWRKLVAAADLIAGLSLDRTRIVLWRPWEPQEPIAELHVASVTGHRAADLAVMEVL